MDLEIEPRVLQAILSHIQYVWRQLPPDRRPRAMSIRLHDPVPAGALDIETPPRAGWFMDSRDVDPGDPSQHLALDTVDPAQPWCAPDWEASTPIFGINVHEIGSAAFACYAGSDSLYLELVWGSLDGIGEKVVVDDQGQVKTEVELWVS